MVPVIKKCWFFISSLLFQPAVCARELCTFSFLSLGVMSDAADDIATEAEVCYYAS